MNNIDERLLAYKPISITLNFDWENTTYDERVQMRHDYIEEQKKKDPNYIGWEFPELFSSKHAGITKNITYYRDFSRVVNTLGQLLSINRGKPYISFVGQGKNFYSLNWIRVGKKRLQVRGHRLVACTFIPIPEELKDQRSYLVVNHKNDIKHCNFKSNLEWCTSKENNIKALNTGARKTVAFKYTVTLTGLYYNHIYYFRCRDELTIAGFSESAVYGDFDKKPYFHGFLEIIDKDELIGKKIGIPEIVLKEIKNPKYGKYGTPPSIGTIISDGLCKGETFVIYGDKQLRSYGFNGGCVSAVISGRAKQHQGCAWSRSSDHPISSLPVGLTEAQKEHIFGKK